ncbi:MAG: PTS transporter subunit EIIC [Bacillota bacterium]|nr:PTS transporter subunit EIIC [Bacillota bacterium]
MKLLLNRIRSCLLSLFRHTQHQTDPVDEISEAGPVDEISEAGPVDEISEAGPVDEISEAGPVDEISEAGPVDEIDVNNSQPTELPADNQKKTARHLPGARKNVLQLPGKMQRCYIQFGSMMILPLSCLGLAGIVMVLADLLARLSVPYAGILLQIGLIVFRYAPLLVAIGIVNGLIVHEKGLAVFAAALSALIWTTAGMAIVQANAPAEAASAYDLGWLTGLAAGFMTFGLFRITERKIRSPLLVRIFNPRSLVVWQMPIAGIGGVISGYLWLLAEQYLIRLALWIPQAGEMGLFVYGLLNRLLLPVGLHHVLDHTLWQQTGDFTTQNGILIQGDLTRFLAGDPTAGQFTAGFFPIMLFVIPAALTAAWLAGRNAQRSLPLLLLIVAAAGSLVGGITEPADFIILLISPLLYILYALLAGLSMVLSAQLQILHGFTFSAGILDYLALWTKATRPEWLLLIGAVLGAIAFAVFYLVMRYFSWSGPAAGQEQASMIRERIKEMPE